MGKPILLLRLEAPLQSWGSRSRWDVRDTATEPTKSGIIGLLGCALGYSMRDPRLEQLNDSLRFGVRVENPGRIIVDYQTITDFLPTADGRFKHSGSAMAVSVEKLRSDPDVTASTIQSPRAYIEDGAFLVALEATTEKSTVLDDCAQAVQQPRWPLFLGRKACVPTRPVFETLTYEYLDIKDALQRCSWSWQWKCMEQRSSKHRQSKPTLDAFLESTAGEPGPHSSSRQDVVRINAARVYGFCTIQRISVDCPNDSADVSSSNQPNRSH